MSEAGRPGSSLHFAVGEINGKMDQLIASILPQLATLAATDADLTKRVTALEVWQGRLGGAFALCIFVVGSWEVVSHVVRR